MAKRSGKSEPEADDTVHDLDQMMEDLTEEERRMFAVVEGFSKLLDETFADGMTFYDVVTVQRLVNTFLMDFLEDMHDGEVTELVDELVDLSCETAAEPQAPAKKAAGPKAKKPKAVKKGK
jgi:hypothetical protein